MSVLSRFLQFLIHPNRLQRWLPLLAFLSLFGYQVNQIIPLPKDYGPYYGDEYFYLQNARAFRETGNLQASFTYSGQGSVIGGFDAHGPAYPMLYGLLHWDGTWSGKHLLIVNFLVYGLGLVLVFSQKVSFGIRLLQGILLSGSPYILFYGQSLMPELIQAGLAIFLFLGMRKFQGQFSKPGIIQIALLILVFAWIRSTWFFALFALAGVVFPKEKGMSLGLLMLGLLGMLVYPAYFHEQTPNVFSQSWAFLEAGEWSKAWMEISFNTKRNLYFLLTYSEGKFYWAWKVWILITLILGFLHYQKSKVLKFGLILLLLHLAFSVLLYKTYRWTDWRMLSPAAILLNLALLQELRFRTESLVLVLASLISFGLLIPFQQKLLRLRKEYSPISVDQETILGLEALEPSLIRVDTVILKEFDLRDLPVQNREGKLLRYSLPYYELREASPAYHLQVQGDQLMIRSTKNLPQ